MDTNTNSSHKTYHFAAHLYKPDADRKELNHSFSALPPLISEVRSFRYGRNWAQNSFDEFRDLFLLTFDNEADRDAYLNDPIHKEYADLVIPQLMDLFVIDFTAVASDKIYNGDIIRLFAFKLDGQENEIKDTINTFEALPSAISQIATFAAGVNNSKLPYNKETTYGAILSFKSYGDLKHFQYSPAYKHFRSVLATTLVKEVVMDMQIEETFIRDVRSPKVQTDKINRIWYAAPAKHVGGGPKNFLVSEKLTHNEFVVRQPKGYEMIHPKYGATKQAIQLTNSILKLQGIESIKVMPHAIQVTLAPVFYWGRDGYADRVADLIVATLFPAVAVDIDNE